jgi:RNA polymerase sigma-70 factor (ECF subfamily)
MSATTSAGPRPDTTAGDVDAPGEAPPAPAQPLALRQLVADHLDFVWRSLRRFGVPQADVDDATQQVFLIANDKLSRIHPGSERSFLVGVATRVASHVRRSYHRREAAEQRLSVNPHDTTPDPEQLAQRLEARALLDKVLDGMPEELRAVFVLFELEELSIDQTASLLILPRGTVATRLRRAREVFHEQAKLVGAGISMKKKPEP